MPLSNAQLSTLLAAIKANPTAGPMRAAGDTFSLGAWCNGPSTTAAWRTAVSGEEVYNPHKPVEYINRSAAERSAFDLMVNPLRSHDFGVQAKRNGVADIFSGATNNSSRTLIFAAAQEFASNAQLVLGGASASVGGTSNMAETVTALKRTYTSQISDSEINWLVAQP